MTALGWRKRGGGKRGGGRKKMIDKETNEVVAMKLALEALEGAVLDYSMGKGAVMRHTEAIKALEIALSEREALAQSRSDVKQSTKCVEQSAQHVGKPVAVMELYKSGWDLVEDIDLDWLTTLPFGTKLYTTPQQRPSRSDIKPLADEQIEQIYKDQTGSFMDDSPWALLDFVRAIEAAHGITSGTDFKE